MLSVHSFSNHLQTSIDPRFTSCVAEVDRKAPTDHVVHVVVGAAVLDAQVGTEVVGLPAVELQERVEEVEHQSTQVG